MFPRKYKRNTILMLFSLSALVSALFFSWLIMAKFDFAYSWLYKMYDIEQHVQIYGPKNRFRDGFEHTNTEEHIRLFAAINTAIHNNGKGLSALKYHHQTGKPIDSLLRTAEIIHLKDVANLINVFFIAGCMMFLMWLGLSYYFYRAKVQAPSLKQQGLGIMGFSVSILLCVLIIGPVKVFYALHTWVFPANHQWFFYYQESLMTILMKAPHLFGGISALIALLAIFIFMGMFALNNKMLNQHKAH